MMERIRTPLPIFYITALISGSMCVQINQIKVPQFVKNGSESSVILDCDFSYTNTETIGLVVKWHFNRNPEPVYQWIPPQKPQALGVLRGRLNLGYMASSDRFTMHRALNIYSPTTNLSGEYMCRVTSFDSEDYRTRRMVVYAPAQDITMTVTKPTEDTVNVTCIAHSIFPKPEMDVLVYKGKKQVKLKWHGMPKPHNRPNPGHTFNATLQRLFQDRTLPAETVFECVVTFHNVDYMESRRIIYFPGANSKLEFTRAGQQSEDKSLDTSLLQVPQFIQNDSWCLHAWTSATNLLLVVGLASLVKYVTL